AVAGAVLGQDGVIHGLVRDDHRLDAAAAEDRVGLLGNLVANRRIRQGRELWQIARCGKPQAKDRSNGMHCLTPFSRDPERSAGERVEVSYHSDALPCAALRVAATLMSPVGARAS